MKRPELLFIFFILMPALANAQYWFQSGARAGSLSTYNNGAKVEIQTLSGQNISSGSIAFWVGETLQNGAFIQVGYLVLNESGNYPSYCTDVCHNYTYIKKGSPSWFYEYFNSQSDTAFHGAVGANGSAGANNTMHTYGFYSAGDIWHIFMDNTTLGEINLGTNNSGNNPPVAFAEAANVTGTDDKIIPVQFKNLSFYRNGTYLPSRYGYFFEGYGAGSLKSIPNPYGVIELYNRTNYFEVGSGISSPTNGKELWSLGYFLTTMSQYGASNKTEYTAYKVIRLQSPEFIYINNVTRDAFNGWSGTGVGSYSGILNETNITMFSNITETASWNTQYAFNLSSPYSKLYGSGWHNSNSTVNISVNPSIIYTNGTSRLKFKSWSNGINNANFSVKANGPLSMRALWSKQYFVSVSSEFGGINGSGWHDANTSIRLSIKNPYINMSSGRRKSFYSWSNNDTNSTITLNVTSPIKIYAEYANQSLINASGIDAYGNKIPISYFYIGGKRTNSTSFVFDNIPYLITGAYYKGTLVGTSQKLYVSSPGQIQISLPVYNAVVRATDIFGIPMNVSLSIRFSNGSTENIYSGRNGTIVIPDVPYGYANVSAYYSGFRFNTEAYEGSEGKILLISVQDISVFAALIIIGFAIYLYSSKKLSAQTKVSTSKPR